MITQTIVGRLREANDRRCNVPLMLRFAHDPETGPLHVAMLIMDGQPGTNEWLIDIDMLVEGSMSRTAVGFGDIKIKRTDTGDVGMCFKNAEGHAHVWLPGLPVQELIRRIQKVRNGPDCLDRLVDEAIEAILNG